MKTFGDEIGLCWDDPPVRCVILDPGKEWFEEQHDRLVHVEGSVTTIVVEVRCQFLRVHWDDWRHAHYQFSIGDITWSISAVECRKPVNVQCMLEELGHESSIELAGLFGAYLINASMGK